MKAVTEMGQRSDVMKFSNKAMLITYPDSLGSNLKDLNKVMNEYFSKSIGGIHLLPFFPSSGDRGFAPERYDVVNDTFGDWENVEGLSKNFYLMFDFMINHLSKRSPEFADFLKNGDKSKYSEMFIDWNTFWPEGHPTQKDIDKIYKRKNKAPYQEIQLMDGSKRLLWNTFGSEQMDLNINSKETKNLIKNVLNIFSKHGASLVRLDAFAYAIKKMGTSDFFVEPEIWDLLKEVSDVAGEDNLMILPEIHEHYTLSKKVNRHNYFTYDFALPMLILHSIYTKKSTKLLKWLNQSPMKQFTTLDTHDGIGVVDVKDILSDKEIKETTDELYKKGSNVKRAYSSAEYNNLDIYQINTTYYSALGENDDSYLLARAIQVFAPGIPQIYYVGLLAGKNDLKLLERTKEGRNINRHYYSENEISQEIQRPVVRKLLNLLQFRNECSAFELNGNIDFTQNDESHFTIVRSNFDKSDIAKVIVDLNNDSFKIFENEKEINL